VEVPQRSPSPPPLAPLRGGAICTTDTAKKGAENNSGGVITEAVTFGNYSMTIEKYSMSNFSKALSNFQKVLLIYTMGSYLLLLQL